MLVMQVQHTVIVEDPHEAGDHGRVRVQHGAVFIQVAPELCVPERREGCHDEADTHEYVPDVPAARLERGGQHGDRLVVA